MQGDDEGPLTRRADVAGHRSANKIRVGEAIAGKYRVEAILGSGGMGSVLRAHHLQLDRPVAIKVMHTELLAVEDTARRFALEGRATAALKSVHTVRILDIDRLPSGAPFMVMELLVGTDLATMVDERGPLEAERAIHYLLQACDAIAEAHAHGIIHRDLKPQNMMLTSEGIVKVFDFGLAKALRPHGAPPESSGTAANVLVGSPSYMAPEQIRSARVDERTDIWALGATLYHLLAGGPPFAASSLLLLTSLITSKDAPRLSEHRPDVTPSVDDVIARCLRKEPRERYQSVAELQAALLHLRAGLQVGGVRDTRISPGATSMGATVPATTRRHGAISEREIPTVPPAPPTEPNPVSTEPPPATVADPRDDEPTQITTGGGGKTWSR